MLEYLHTHEAAVRLGSFAGLLLLLFGAERLLPRRAVGRLGRVGTNLLIVVLNTLLLRLCFPLMAVGVAIWAAGHGWGLFNLLAWPSWWEVIAAILLLDMLIYWQHRLMHAVPLLWRLHRMHHSDLAFDVSTAVRFHPLEIGLSMLIKMAAVLLLGADPGAVILFEVILSSASLFEHANLRLTKRLDNVLRCLIVTPDMHRVHHSVHQLETDSNFGFSLSVWDRLFGSYRAQPQDGHDAMQIGLHEFRQHQDQGFSQLMLQPFRQVSPQPRQ